jgi:hypothetical protein
MSQSHSAQSGALHKHAYSPALEENEDAFFAKRVAIVQKALLPKLPRRLHNRHVFDEPELPKEPAAKASASFSDPPPPSLLSQDDIFEHF